MKNPIVSFIVGAVTGSVAAYGSLFIVSYVIHKSVSENKSNEHETLLKNVKALLSGTKFEDSTDQYVSIINESYNLFENDYDIIMKKINDILDSDNSNDEILSTLESFVVSLDILNNSAVNDSSVDNAREEFKSFFEKDKNNQ